MNDRWCINKVGLLNFWYYDEEEFSFSDGKLLLRGSNGSGKSVTMQSFIPLLLDGNKSPDRLDPFGSRARRLENYLLGEEDGDREERTAYLYMEFIKESSGKYLTIGMGFKAQRGKALQSWGFAITDGRRVGQDIFLYKDMGDKIPLTKRELQNRIEDGGMVKEGQKEYMKMVNDLLFGFDEIEEYDEMIKLLIQLRTPKLSKDFKPTVVYEIMENSLQQLSEDDLRPMSESIENMDNIKMRLEELKESKRASERIKDSYDKYNRYVLYEKATNYLNSNKQYEGLMQQRRKLEEKRDNANIQFEDALKKIDELRADLSLAEENKKQLDNHDSIKIKERLYDLEKIIEDSNIEIARKTTQLDDKKASERELYGRIKDNNGKKDTQKKKALETLEEMDELAEDFAFDEQTFMKEELKKDIEALYDFSYIQGQIKTHIEKLNKAKEALIERDRHNRDHDKAVQEFNMAKNKVVMDGKKYEEAELFLAETKEELLENIYSWKNQNNELLIDNDKLIGLSRRIQNFREDSSFDDIISIIREILNQKQDILNKQISDIDFNINQLKQKKFDIEKKINELKDNKEIEPERTNKVKKHRDLLVKKQIPHLPLYKAFDFKDDLPLELKGKIEEALLDMGLLDALIIPERYKNEALLMEQDMGDKYIFSSPNLLTHSLGEFLKLERTDTVGISAMDLDNALKSILIDNNSSAFINEKGEYGIGIIKGKTSSEYIPKYIGSTARETYRLLQIEILNIEINGMDIDIQNMMEHMKTVSEKVVVLNKEFQDFPRDTDLRVALNYLKESHFNLERAKENLKEKADKEQDLYKKLKELDQEVYELTHKLNLKVDLDIYQEAIDSATKYQELLYIMVNLNGSIIGVIEITNNLEEQKEDTELDIENLSGDLYQLEKRNLESKNTKISLEEQLSLTDFKEIEREIDECLRLINEIPRLIETQVSRSATEKSNFEHTIDSLNLLMEQVSLCEKELLINQEVFSEEFKLRLCNLADLEDKYKNANMVLKEIKPQDKRDRDHFTQQLYSKFTENTQYLREFILRIDNIILGDEENNVGRRLYIKGKVRGKDIDFYELLRFIDEGIEENERLLKESDRQLFEDILVNTISKKIRAKIYHSQMWVARMNDLMENMNTSSGLSFSLNWASKKAENEGQLDTRELVELLKQEGSLMKESDLSKLSEHFRSKIAEARRVQEDTGKSQSFHMIMREVLDYRKWFEFKLNYKKTGQNKKELTNNAFFQLSGGEKAMAMYVPLFSAVYARFKGARTDAPRIISLDEAFAGVDEKNIRDMFRLLDELDLDYMINSQILWGDYDTVQSLAISELIRPDNANFVTVIRYHWNGNVKELVI